MTRTLVIHIGGHKTGSTSIQEAFASGQVRLKGAQIQYPARLDHNYLRADVLSYVNGTPLPARGPRMLSFAQLAAQIANTEAPYTLLSAEYFETVEPEIFKGIVTQHFAPVVDKIRIVAYVRPHVARLVSGYNEARKIGWFPDGIEAFFHKTVAEGTQHYAPRFAEWRTAFGDAFVLRPMVRGQLAGGSVLEDFLATAFPGEEVDTAPQLVRNTSLDLHDQTFVHMIQEPFRKRQNWFRHTFGWELARQLQALPRDPQKVVGPQHLDRALAEKVAATYSADAAELDATFFGGTRLFQDALAASVATVPETALICTPHDVLGPDALSHVNVLRALLGDVLSARYNWSAHFHGQRISLVERALAESCVTHPHKAP